jgi:competence protein ComEA
MTAPSMRSASRSSISGAGLLARPVLARFARLAGREARPTLALLLLVFPTFAQLPAGPGKAEIEKLCAQCHEIERSISLRQDRAGWQATVDKMAGLGMKASDKEVQAAIDYLAAHYPASEVPPLNVNKARSIDFESALSLPRSQAARIIDYRTSHGDFHSLDDLKKVPGVDAAKIEAKKDRIVFQ